MEKNFFGFNTELWLGNSRGLGYTPVSSFSAFKSIQLIENLEEYMRKRLKVNSESGKALLQTFPETASVHCMHRIATPGHRQQIAMSTETKTWNAT